MTEEPKRFWVVMKLLECEDEMRTWRMAEITPEPVGFLPAFATYEDAEKHAHGALIQCLREEENPE